MSEQGLSWMMTLDSAGLDAGSMKAVSASKRMADSFRSTEGEVRALQKAIENTNQSASKPGEGIIKGLKSQFGEESGFGGMMKILAGGGAIMGIGIAARAIDGMAKGAEKFAVEMAKGEKSTLNMTADLVESIPIVGNLADAFARIGGLIGGWTVEEALANAQYKSADESIKKIQAGMEAVKGATEDATKSMRDLATQAAGVGLKGISKSLFDVSASAADRNRGIVDTRDKRLEKTATQEDADTVIDETNKQIVASDKLLWAQRVDIVKSGAQEWMEGYKQKIDSFWTFDAGKAAERSQETKKNTQQSDAEILRMRADSMRKEADLTNNKELELQANLLQIEADYAQRRQSLEESLQGRLSGGQREKIKDALSGLTMSEAVEQEATKQKFVRDAKENEAILKEAENRKALAQNKPASFSSGGKEMWSQMASATASGGETQTVRDPVLAAKMDTTNRLLEKGFGQQSQPVVS